MFIVDVGQDISHIQTTSQSRYHGYILIVRHHSYSLNNSTIIIIIIMNNCLRFTEVINQILILFMISNLFPCMETHWFVLRTDEKVIQGRGFESDRFLSGSPMVILHFSRSAG